MNGNTEHQHQSKPQISHCEEDWDPVLAHNVLSVWKEENAGNGGSFLAGAKRRVDHVYARVVRQLPSAPLPPLILFLAIILFLLPSLPRLLSRRSSQPPCTTLTHAKKECVKKARGHAEPFRHNILTFSRAETFHGTRVRIETPPMGAGSLTFTASLPQSLSAASRIP
eukprot:1456931-Rhodomonas_salina.2